MNADTKRKIEQIKKDGYYTQGLSLGVGGIPALNKFAADWHTYILKMKKECCTLTAKDEWTAIETFKKLYDLDKCEYEILEKVVTYRCIAGSLKFCTVGKK
jgi:hypothetical protein